MSETTNPTLDDVYKQYNVQPQRQTEQSETQPQAESPAPGSQDAVSQQVAALVKEVQGLRQESEALRKESQASAESADLKGVLDSLSKKLEGVKEKHIKYELAERYNTDDKFKQVWDDRKNNPEALTAALDALIPVLQEDLAIKADPKIASDQRAFDTALQGADTGPSEASDDETHRLMKFDEGSFDNEWRKLVTSG